MSDTYTKLFSSITASTVWGEPYPTRIVWVAMLAMADAQGNVYGAIPGLARHANVTLTEVEDALRSFLAPDPYSRTRDHDGRRIEEVDGGWRLINHAKYSAVRGESERREYKRQWDRENRSKQSDSHPTISDKPDSNPTKSDHPTPPAPTPSLTEEAKAKPSVQHAARFEDFWSVYPNKKGKQEAEKRWRKDGLDAIADRIIAHVRHMAAHDDAWRRGFEPMGSTYLNQARWTDEARGAPLTASQQPGKQLQGLMALEGMKHGVVPQRNHHGYPEIGLPGSGAPALGRSAAGDRFGVAGGAGQRLALGPGRGRAEDSRGVLDLGPDSYCVAESAEDA